VLRPTRRQLNLEDLLGWEQRIPRNSVWHALRTWREAHLKDEDFAELYKATGRPAVSPARLTCALLIQGVSVSKNGKQAQDGLVKAV